MADTIVNTTPARTDSGSGAGWVVGLIIVLLLIAGGVYAFMRFGSTAAAPAGGSANINVTLPSGGGNTGGSAGGSAPAAGGSGTGY